MSSEFYVGYQDRAPHAVAQHSRRVLLGLAGSAVGLLALSAWLQSPADPGRFEFGQVRSFEGVLHESPLPVLRQSIAGGAPHDVLLVGEGKHGLPAFARGHDRKRVRFDGTLIEAQGVRMVELNRPSSFQLLGPAEEDPATEPPRLDLGPHSLTGELVDTKCYFGVMRPATGKVHRGCAARCLSGGVPPGLLLRTQDGNATVVLLSFPADSGIRLDPQWAGRVIRADGALTVEAGLARLACTRLVLAD